MPTVPGPLSPPRRRSYPGLTTALSAPLRGSHHEARTRTVRTRRTIAVAGNGERITIRVIRALCARRNATLQSHDAPRSVIQENAGC